MKKKLALVLTVLIISLSAIETLAAPQASDISAAIDAIYENTGPGTELFSDEMEEFDQSIIYDEKTNTFTHLVFSQNYATIAWMLLDRDNLELTPDIVKSCENAYEVYKYIKAMTDRVYLNRNGCSDAHLVFKYVSTINQKGKDYKEFLVINLDTDQEAIVLKDILDSNLSEGESEQKVHDASSTIETSSVSWSCFSCGHENTTDFCEECGAVKPTWTCVCGNVNHRKFCGKCGKGYVDLRAEFDGALVKVSQQKYDEAISDLENLGLFDSGTLETSVGDHVSAKSYISKIYYDQGIALVAVDGDHNKIIEFFTKAGDYEDAEKQIQDENDRYYKAFYDDGERHLANSEYDAAIESFQKAGEYSDAVERIQKIHYELGEKALETGEWETASLEFSAAGTYKDAASRINESFEDQIEVLISNKDYARAIDALEKRSDESAALSELKKKAYYYLGIENLEQGNPNKALECFQQSENYNDSSDKVIDALCAIADNQMASDDYSGAKKTIKKIKNKSRQNEEMNEYYYRFGIFKLNNDSLDMAIDNLAKVKNKKDANNYLMDAYEKKLEQLLSKQEYQRAEANYNSLRKLDSNYQYPMNIAPGDESEEARKIMEIASCCGFIFVHSDSKLKYEEEYVDGIKKMEGELGLVADGNINLNEFLEICQLYYPGYEGDSFSNMIERIWDLGFVTERLPDVHKKYEKEYLNGIKKLEKKLKLTVDGLLTAAEQQIIFKQLVDRPGDIKKINYKFSDGKCTLTWKPTRCAVKYDVWVFASTRSGNYKSWHGTVSADTLQYTFSFDWNGFDHLQFEVEAYNYMGKKSDHIASSTWVYNPKK